MLRIVIESFWETLYISMYMDILDICVHNYMQHVCKYIYVCVCVCVHARAYFPTYSTDIGFGIKKMCLATCSCLKLSHHFNTLQPLKFVCTIHLRSVYASVQLGKRVLNYTKHELKIVTIASCFHVKEHSFKSFLIY